MANSRLYLRNKVSGKFIYIGKSFGGGYYPYDYLYKDMDLLFDDAVDNGGLYGFEPDGDTAREIFEFVDEDELEDWDKKISWRDNDKLKEV